MSGVVEMLSKAPSQDRVAQLFLEVFKAFSLDRAQGRSSGPSVPAGTSCKEAASRAKRAPLHTLCIGCIQTQHGRSSCSSSMLADRMSEACFCCGTKLNCGVAVFVAQTAAWTT